jgi:hypothetical protein
MSLASNYSVLDVAPPTSSAAIFYLRGSMYRDIVISLYNWTIGDILLLDILH